MVKNYKLFILSILISFVAVNILYIAFFDKIIPKKIKVSHLYQQFLLENTKTPRLIVESGSNSLYAIDSKMLEDKFNILTINVSDAASLPLKYKLLKLEKYVKKGDIVLMPLEWQFYSRDEILKQFLDQIFQPLSHYYTTLLWDEKIELIYKTPFSSLRAGFFKNNLCSATKYRYGSEYNLLKGYMQIFDGGKRGDGEYKLPKKSLVGHLICSSYIFRRQIEDGFEISQSFKDNIKKIKELEKKGVKFIITWPAVVGEGCYKGDHGKYFRIFFKKIKKFLDEHSINYVGEWQDSSFPKKYFLNTYYHILEEAKEIRTKKLIERIENSSYKTWFNQTKKPETNFTSLFNSIKKEFVFYHKRLKNNQRVEFNEKNFDNEVVLEKNNWYEMENWGIWSKGESSKIIFSVNNSKNPLKIKIDSTIFKKDQNETEIYINNQKLGIYNLNGVTQLTIPNSFIKNSLVELEFKHLNQKLPIDYGVTDENRSLKLGLKSIVITN